MAHKQHLTPDIQSTLAPMFEAMQAKLDESNTTMQNMQSKIDDQAKQNRSIHEENKNNV